MVANRKDAKPNPYQFRLTDFERAVRSLVNRIDSGERLAALEPTVDKLIARFRVPSGAIDYSKGLFSRTWKETWLDHGFVTHIPIDTPQLAHALLIPPLNQIRQYLVHYLIEGPKYGGEESYAAECLINSFALYESRKRRLSNEFHQPRKKKYE